MELIIPPVGQTRSRFLKYEIQDPEIAEISFMSFDFPDGNSSWELYDNYRRIEHARNRKISHLRCLSCRNPRHVAKAREDTFKSVR